MSRLYPPVRVVCLVCGLRLTASFCPRCHRTTPAPPPTPTIPVSVVARWRILIDERIRSRYNGHCPVQLDLKESPVWDGIEVSVGVPGQNRMVLLSKSRLTTLGDPRAEEEALDEVLYAVYTLLEDLEE